MLLRLCKLTRVGLGLRNGVLRSARPSLFLQQTRNRYEDLQEVRLPKPVQPQVNGTHAHNRERCPIAPVLADIRENLRICVYAWYRLDVVYCNKKHTFT